jgi:hypothetical protein
VTDPLFADTAAFQGVTYYRVSAVNNLGESALSNDGVAILV